MHELDEDHIHLDDEDAVAYLGERVQLLSVGVDIGSSTSHLVFSDLVLQRQGQRLSSRYTVTERQILYRSPVIFTPYASSGQIDAPALGAFIAQTYQDAGMQQDQVDAGALITTGEAARRQNARAIAELFSREGGKFVVATAGPNLESLLAAHGSGAAEMSLDAPSPVLNIDIGGGTTKFAVCVHGEVRQTGAIHLGSRLIAWDAQGRVMRVEEAGRCLARAAGITTSLALGEPVSADVLDSLALHMADVIVAVALGAEHDGAQWITPVLRLPPSLRTVVYSGGVAEYVYGRETREFGDLGPRLAEALRDRAQQAGMKLLEPREAIRATCIGASQYTVQLSGDTIFLSDPQILPLRSLPVVAARGIAAPSAPQVASAVRQAMARLDLTADDQTHFALALHWHHGADYASLRELCAGIVDGVGSIPDGQPLLVVMDADVAGLVGTLLQREFGVSGNIVCIDQVELREFDYIDIGRLLPAQGVVPVVVKSLVFR